MDVNKEELGKVEQLFMLAKTGVELLEICEKHNISLSEYAIRCAHMKRAAMLQYGTRCTYEKSSYAAIRNLKLVKS